MLDWLGCEQLHANAKPPVMPMRSGFLCARAPASPPRGSILFQPRLVHHQARAVLVAEHALLQEAVQAAGVEPDQALVFVAKHVGLFVHAGGGKAVQFHFFEELLQVLAACKQIMVQAADAALEGAVQHFHEGVAARVMANDHEVGGKQGLALVVLHVAMLRACAEGVQGGQPGVVVAGLDRKSTRLNSSHTVISYAVFCLKKKKKKILLLITHHTYHNN